VSTAAKYRNRDGVRCRTRVRMGLRPRGRRHTDPGAGPGSGTLSRKNAIVGPSAACPEVSGQRAESAVSRLALASRAEGQ
jgi:hypothetical protein